MQFKAKTTVRIQGVYALHLPGAEYPYVGQSIHILKRFSTHRSNLERGEHPCTELQSAYDGEVQLEILEVVPKGTELDEAERRWVRGLNAFPDGRASRHGTYLQLSDVEVRAVRACRPIYRQNTLGRLARELGVDKSMIYRIRARTAYRHVE